MAATSEFLIERIEPTNGAVILAVKGWLDLGTASRLRSTITEYDGRAIVVDLEDVTFLDSTGIAVLIGAHKRAARSGVTFGVRNLPSMPRRVLQIAGVDDLLLLEE